MNLSVIISGGVSILIGLSILIMDREFWSLIWSFFFIGLGISIMLYSKEADKIEKIRRVKNDCSNK